MTSRISPLQPGDAADDEVNEFLRKAAEGWYEDTAYFGAIAHQPALLKDLVSIFEQFPQSSRLGADLFELMRLKIAHEHRCAYCGTVRTAAVREEVAPKEQALFEDDLESDVFSQRERSAIRLAGHLSKNPHGISDGFFEELRESFTDDELIELLLFASLEVGLDRFCIALQLNTTQQSHYPTGLEYPLENPEPQN